MAFNIFKKLELDKELKIRTEFFKKLELNIFKTFKKFMNWPHKLF